MGGGGDQNRDTKILTSANVISCSERPSGHCKNEGTLVNQSMVDSHGKVGRKLYQTMLGMLRLEQRRPITTLAETRDAKTIVE